MKKKYKQKTVLGSYKHIKWSNIVNNVLTLFKLCNLQTRSFILVFQKFVFSRFYIEKNHV
jgi:hypothetical protein